MAVSDAVLLAYYLQILPDLEREQGVGVRMNASVCPCHLADFR